MRTTRPPRLLKRQTTGVVRLSLTVGSPTPPCRPIYVHDHPTTTTTNMSQPQHHRCLRSHICRHSRVTPHVRSRLNPTVVSVHTCTVTVDKRTTYTVGSPRHSTNIRVTVSSSHPDNRSRVVVSPTHSDLIPLRRPPTHVQVSLGRRT